MIKSRKPASTLADAAYERLRADLLACRLVPGEAIKINEVSILFGTNPIAIREALSKLTAEGFVTAEPQKGFRAAPISAADLRDLTLARAEIEGICLRMSIEAGGLEWESCIIAALHRLLATPVRVADDPSRNNEEWVEQHRLFHEALVGGCGSQVLLGFRAVLFAKTGRYRRLSVPMAVFERDLDSEHKGLAMAVLNRDIPAAVDLMVRHLQATADILLKTDSSMAFLQPCDSK